MVSRKLTFLLVVVAFLSACQPARNQDRQRIARGRSDGSNSYSARTSGTGASTGLSNKVWGEVTSSSDSLFQNALINFTLPSLQGLAAEDQLGYVSSQDGQNTGVRFYGNAVTNGQYGSMETFDPAQMMIHVEIYDDKTGHTRSDGSIRPPIIIEISKDLSTFVQANGTYNAQTGAANMTFEDQYGSINLQGNLASSGMFSGTFSYSTKSVGNVQTTLGQFSVYGCGFFQCQ